MKPDRQSQGAALIRVIELINKYLLLDYLSKWYTNCND